MPMPRRAAATALVASAALSAILGAAGAKSTTGGSKACSHTGFYSKKIVPLCEKHFPEASSKHAWVVQFYHPYVKKVQESKGALEALAAAPKRIEGAKVGAVDCQQNGPFCAKHGINEAPTTHVLVGGAKQEFIGEHTEKALEAFIKESLKRLRELGERGMNCPVKGVFIDAKKDSTIPLCTKEFPPSLEPLPWLIGFYEAGDRNKDKTFKSTMNKLAEKYGNSPPKKPDLKKSPRLRFGAISCGQGDNDCEGLGVSTYPAVRFYSSGADPVDFDSFFDKDELKQFAEASLKAMPKPKEAEVLQGDTSEGGPAGGAEEADANPEL